MNISESQQLKGVRILVAEDDKIGATILKRLFEIWNVACEVVENGEEVLAKMAQQDFDLVLMDMQMPVLDGLGTVQQIRSGAGEINKKIPIIGLSAHSGEDAAQKCLSAGMNDYICKPFEPDFLYKKIVFHIKDGPPIH